MLLNEGGGQVFEYDGRRRYGVCCGEKGIFRFKLTATGTPGTPRCRRPAITRC